MSLYDASGMPIRKVTDDQLIVALNTVVRRNQALQMQLMQLGLLVEFVIEKLSSVQLSDGTPVFAVDEKEFEDFSRRRYEEIKVQAKEFQQILQESPDAQTSVDLEE